MSKKRKGKIVKKVNRVEVDESRLKFRANQTATAFVGQGGNAIAINANEVANLRIRSGQQ